MPFCERNKLLANIMNSRPLRRNVFDFFGVQPLDSHSLTVASSAVFREPYILNAICQRSHASKNDGKSAQLLCKIIVKNAVKLLFLYFG